MASVTEILDMSFVGRDHGFALASAKCRSKDCLLIAETTDGARTWVTRGSLPAKADVSSLRFVTPTIGYAFGYDFWMTQDGGRHWTREATAGVGSLEGNRHDVLRVVGDCSGEATLERAAPGSSIWHAAGKVSGAANSVCPPTVYRDGAQRVVVVGYGNSAKPEPDAWIGVSSDGGQSFARRTDPCVSAQGHAADVGLAPKHVIAVFCISNRVDDLGDSNGWLTLSSDDGSHYGPKHLWGDSFGTGTTQSFVGIVAASASRLLVATSSPHVGRVDLSEDGGVTWEGEEEFAVPDGLLLLGFQDPHTARVAERDIVATTRDGGRTWREDQMKLRLPGGVR